MDHQEKVRLKAGRAFFVWHSEGSVGVITDEKLARINELARKARETGLNEAEREEQQRLRREYAAAFRGDLERQLNSIVIVDEAGNRRKVHKRGKR